MKKIAIFALACVLSLSACSKPKDAEEAPKSDAPEAAAKAPQEMLDAVEFTEEGLDGLFKTKGKMTPEEFEALMLGYAKCDIGERDDPNEAYKYYDCPANTVYIKVTKPIDEEEEDNTGRELDPAAKQKVLMKLLKHENPVVRDKAFEEVELLADDAGLEAMVKGEGLMKGDNEAINAVVAIAKEEKDPAVFNHFYQRVLWIDSMKNNPDLVAFVNETAKKDNPAFRYSFAEKLAASRVKGFPEVSQTMLDICQNDPDKKVKNKACGRILDFEIPDNMKIAADILKDPELAGAHSGLLENLQRRWHSYPSYDKFDADAYTLWLDYYKTKDRSEDVPEWSGLSITINKDKFEEFKKGATYFKEAEFANVMGAIAEDAKASYLARTGAVKAIKTMVSKANADKKLKAIDAKLDKAKDDKRVSQIKEAIKDALEEND